MSSSLSLTNSSAAGAATATTDSSENRPNNIQEEKFLQSRQERQNRKSSVNDDVNARIGKTSALFAFWKVLRQKLTEWEQKLINLEKEGEATVVAAPVEANKGNKKNRKQEVRTELERLRLDLDQWRRHCLSNNTILASEVESVKWEVPDEFPVSDLRLLHAEFTKYSSKWEAVHDKLFPRGKFVFRRYRQELARRNIRQEDLFNEQKQRDKQKNCNQRVAFNGTVVSTTTNQQASHSQHGHVSSDGRIQNLSYANLVVSKSGNVDCKSIRIPNEVFDVPLELTSTSLLVRNLKHCSLVM